MTVIYSFIAFLIAALSAASKKLNLLRFVALYIVLSLFNLFVAFYIKSGWSILMSIGICSLLFLVLLIIVAGLVGTKISTINYCALLSLGLFPYFIGWQLTLVFFTIVIIVFVVCHKTLFIKARKSLCLTKDTYARTVLKLRKMPKETQDKFYRLTQVNLGAILFVIGIYLFLVKMWT